MSFTCLAVLAVSNYPEQTINFNKLFVTTTSLDTPLNLCKKIISIFKRTLI